MVRAQRLRLRKGHQEADGVVGATETKGDGRTERRNGDDRVSSGARRCIPVPSSRLSVALVFLSACATLRQLAFTEPDLQLREIDVTGIGFTGGTFDLVDRKSTRLNSSHGYISYAVFCLKKKKQTRDHASHTTHTITRS